MDLLIFLPPFLSGIVGIALCVLIARKPKGEQNKLSLKLLLWFFILQAISALFTALFFGLGYTVENMGNYYIFYSFTITYQASYIVMWALTIQIKYSSGIFNQKKFWFLIIIYSILFLINDLYMKHPLSVYTSYIG
ncbi:MAG: hypothetical protein GF364_13170, partial [Candidatus Lokiarchaeota archaeon]|nr:hypothetical protein [Candidatus Lokiarchaeota archaeon]